MAWPWFSDTLEISTPRPSVTNRNRMAPSANTAYDPRKGTPKMPTPTPTTIARSSAATPK
jgi:hypothetical protein